MKSLIHMFTWFKAIQLAIAAVVFNRLYILRKAALGDVLWVEPVIRTLALQNRNMIVVTDFPVLFQNYPFPHVQFVHNNVKAYKRAAKLLHWCRLKNHVVYLNDTYEKQPHMHFLHAYQQVAGIPVCDEYPRLYLTEAEKERFAHLPPYAVIHLETTSSWNHRQVYGIDWQEIVDYLHSMGVTPYFIARNPTTEQLPYFIDVDVRGMMSLLYHARLFIGIDSGPSHLAASLRVPSVIFFGSINPWYRHFKGLFRGIIMQQACEFANCYHRPQKRKKDYSCLIVQNEDSPKCCVFTSQNVIDAIGTIQNHNHRFVENYL